ncbi:MAG TPA: histidine kinase [Noviherbaspirillum sp.]|nr:histidine kinase [Noviherbaspirillum sp.]
MNLAPPAPAVAYPRLRRFAIDVAIVSVFNVAIALFITYVLRIHDSLTDNIVISMCIGTLAVTFIDGTRLLLWPHRAPPLVPFLLLLAVSIPAAQLIGSRIAGALTGIPSLEIAGVRSGNVPGAIVMLVLVCLGITWFFWSRERLEHLKAEAAAEKARAAEIERRALQAQLQLLQAQTEPHMLFNTLANLQGLIAVDPPRAGAMLDQLIQYLRASLSSSRAQAVTLEQEFALLDAYLGLMKVRMDARLSYRLDLPAELAALPVPPMLLQPLVENAIKHGLEPKLDGGALEVKATRRDRELVLSVCDTGLGDACHAHTAGGGTGLANVRERLAALFGGHASLLLQPNQPCGLRATLTIPL